MILDPPIIRKTAQAAGLALALLLTLLIVAPASGAPRIVVEPSAIDFGVMEQDLASEQSVTIRNDGDATLLISHVSSTCGCTAAEPDKKELAPGESTVMNVTFRSGKFRGPQMKYVKISSNDPLRGTLDVAVLADVFVQLWADPMAGLRFRHVVAADSPRDTFFVASSEVDVLEAEPIRFNDELFAVETLPAYQGDPRSVGFIVKIREDAPAGGFTEVIRIGTNVSGKGYIDVDMKGDIVGRVLLVPDRVNFRYLTRDHKTVRTIGVRSYDESVDLVVTAAECDLPGFVVKEIIKRKKNFYEIRLEGYPIEDGDERAVETRGRIDGALVVYTNVPDMPQAKAELTYLLKM